MEIKFWKIVDEKRAWVLLRVHRWLLVGPVFIPNFYGNNPWVLGGRTCPFIGWRSRYVGGGTRTVLLTFGPVALALVIAVGDHWE